MTFAGNVTNDFKAVGQADLCDLTQSRVRLLRRRRVDAGANTALLRVLLESRNLITLYLRLARLADQLVYGRHSTIPCKILSRHPCGLLFAVSGTPHEQSPQCAKSGPTRFRRWTTISRGRNSASCVQHSVFNVRLEPCLRRTPERVAPNSQTSHGIRWRRYYWFNAASSRPVKKLSSARRPEPPALQAFRASMWHPRGSHAI